MFPFLRALPPTNGDTRDVSRPFEAGIMTKAATKIRLLLSLFLLSSLLAACASSGGEGGNLSDDNLPPGGSIDKRLLTFTMAVNPNGSIDRSGRGLYVILLNAQATPIEATDLDTFTDFIRFDGQNFDWYHRLAEVPNPGFTFVQVGPLSGQAQVTPDGKSIQVVLDVGQSTSYLNQYIPGQIFTAHALTTDNSNGALLGRLIDTMGQGPNINANSLHTISVRRGQGAVRPLPQSYPFDPLGDTVFHDSLGGDFPYANFDIVRFEVTAQ